MTFTSLRRVFVPLAFLGAAAIANASTFIQTATPVAPTQTDLTNANLAFAGWNAIACAGCTLTGVDFNITGNISGTISLHNTNPINTVTANGTTSADFTINDLNGNLAIHDVISTGVQTIGPGGTFSSALLANSNSVDSGLITSGLAAYLSAFNAQVSTLTGSGFAGGGGNVTLSAATSASAVGTITYTYTPAQTGTPEPGTMALFGTALIGLFFFGRKRLAR